MNVTIEIGTPVLLAGQSFKVRYKLLPSGSYVTVSPNKTNAPFTLNLTAGNYLFEFTLVNADATECPPTYQNFTVKNAIPCITFTPTLIAHNDHGKAYYTLEIAYSGTPTACSYIVSYTPVGGVTVTNTYATLPASPISYFASNIGYHVKVQSCDCDNVCTTCYEDDINPLTIECTKGNYDGDCYFYEKAQSDHPRGGMLHVHVYAFPSPMCSTVTFYYQQQQLSLNPVGSADAGTAIINLVAGQLDYYITINPNATMLGASVGGNGRAMDYNGNFVDCCGATIMTYGGGVYYS